MLPNHFVLRVEKETLRSNAFRFQLFFVGRPRKTKAAQPYTEPSQHQNLFFEQTSRKDRVDL